MSSFIRQFCQNHIYYYHLIGLDVCWEPTLERRFYCCHWHLICLVFVTASSFFPIFLRAYSTNNYISSPRFCFYNCKGNEKRCRCYGTLLPLHDYKLDGIYFWDDWFTAIALISIDVAFFSFRLSTKRLVHNFHLHHRYRNQIKLTTFECVTSMCKTSIALSLNIILRDYISFQSIRTIFAASCWIQGTG